MSGFVGRLLAGLVGATSGVLVLAALYACASAPTPAQQVNVADLTAQDALCLKGITSGESRAAVDLCRDAVREVYCAPDGGLLADSGACVNVRLSDGGLP